MLLAVNQGKALAGSFDHPGHGVFAMSRGGAFAARADNPTAILYNPAGAAWLAGTHIVLDGNILMEDIRYQPKVYGEPGDPSTYPHTRGVAGSPAVRMPEVQNTADPFITPFLGASTDLGVMRSINLRLLLGVYGPHVHPQRTFPAYCAPGVSPCEASTKEADGLPNPARYDILAQDILVVYPSIGLAWSFKWISVGAVFQATIADFYDKTTVSSLMPTYDPKWDVAIELNAQDNFTPTGIIGVHAKPLDFLEAGASVRIGYTLDFEGTVETFIPPELSGYVKVDKEGDVSVKLNMPWVVRTGVRYVNRDGQGRERFDVELDFVYETASQVERIEIVPQLKIEGKVVQQMPKTYNWKDMWTIHLGGTYNIHDLFGSGTLRISLGGFYESAAVEDEYTRLDFTSFPRYGVAGGVDFAWAFGWGSMKLALGYMHTFHETREVQGSKVLSLVPLYPADQGKVIGEGTYKIGIDAISIGLAANF